MADLDEYLSNIVAGDSDAFARWVAGAEPSLRGLLRPFAARVDTEAVLQEALLRVWQVAPRFKPDGRPNALLRFGARIAQNLAFSEARRLRPEPASPELEERLNATLDELRAAEPDPLLRQVIVRCREKLKGKPAAALMHRILSVGEPDEALAAQLGMRLNTFLQNFTRARKLLAECLARNGIDLFEVWR